MANKFPIVSWAAGSGLYEVNIRQYTPEGTFAAFQRHLPRLQDMGVEILWLMPVTPISIEKRQGSLGSYYACSSYTSINPEFGNLDDFRHLLADARSRGMKVIIDWVANHTGWDHHWKTEHPEWYYKNESGEFYDKNGWIDVIDLDYSQDALRQEMIRSMQYWVSACDIDGFRCDMAHLVPLDFWTAARTACDAIKPLFWLAETDNSDYHDVFDVTYAWSWMHASERVFKGHAPFHEFVHESKRLIELPDQCYKLLFTSNHDENSWNGTEKEKYGSATKPLAVFCCTWTGMPLVYSGQELPNTRRLKFFDKDEITWSENISLHSFYQAMLQYREQSPALREGNLELLETGNEQVLAFVRTHGNETALVLLNFSAAERVRVQLSHDRLHGQFNSLFSGLAYAINPEMEFELDPWGYLVYIN